MKRRGARAFGLPLLLLFCLLASACARAALTGVVIGVGAGDAVTVRVDERLLWLKLARIDAPEPGQPFDTLSMESLAEVCLNKIATIDEVGIDKARGVFAQLECDGIDAAAEQVRRGMAWISVHHPHDIHLYPLQARAREARRGLWRDAAPVPPWEWRAMQP